jgi:lysophospholipase L1-like esterase
MQHIHNELKIRLALVILGLFIGSIPLIIYLNVRENTILIRQKMLDDYLNPRGIFIKSGEYYISNANLEYSKEDKYIKYIRQNISVNKIENTYRIFIYGESSVAGTYPVNKSALVNFALQLDLENYFHNKNFEVINLGKAGCDSSYIKNAMLESIHYQPDLIIIYAGHNEFGKGVVEEIMGVTEVNNPDDFYNQKNKLLNNYKRNVGDIISITSSNHVPLILITMASNLADREPTYSIFFGNLSRQKTFDTLMSKAETFWKNNEKYEAYLQYLSAEKFGESALLFFRLGTYWEKINNTLSLNYFKRAKDLDTGFKERAFSDLNDYLRGINSTNVFIMDFEAVVERIALSKNETVGCNLFGNKFYCDYIHPNEKLHKLMADEIFKTILKENLIT